MMNSSSKFQLFFIVLLLSVMGLSTALYKYIYLDIPLTPHEKRSMYTITASISIKKSATPIHVSLAVPQEQAGMKIVETEVDSGDFGYTLSEENGVQRANWAKKSLSKTKSIFYKLTILPDLNDMAQDKPLKDFEYDTVSKLPYWKEDQISALNELVAYADERSADDATFSAEVIALFNSSKPIDAVKTLLKIDQESKTSLIMEVLKYKKVKHYKIKGIKLEDRQKNKKPITMLKVNSKGQWYLFSLKSGRITLPKNFFIWHEGNSPLFRTIGDTYTKLRFSVSESKVLSTTATKKILQNQNEKFLDFSLYTLPSAQQNSFKAILLIPIGALIVVIMRILVGVKTMGTFMPILFSLAFIQTTLLSGLVMFLTILSVGLFVRSYLARLELLLVARISAVIIVVVTIMSIMSIVSYKLGIEEVLQITFFPMIILSWTIERMSILWEEEGSKAALVQGGGSMIVAVIAYFAMDNEMVHYLTFNFPELLLVVLALIILIGRYTGYRLSELIRFAPLGK